jgi:hypothetical protein
MSILGSIGLTVVVIIAIIIIIAVFASRGMRRHFQAIARGEKERPTSRDNYFAYLQWMIKELEKHNAPVSQLFQFAATEIDHIFVSGNTETKMHWLNAWGLTFNHELKPRYTPDVWETEGFEMLHSKVAEYAKGISSKGLEIPFRPGFDADEIIARHKKLHPED